MHLDILGKMDFLEPHIVPIVGSDEVSAWWPRVKPWADDFCEHSQGSFDSGYILDNLTAEMMQLWVVMRDDELIAVCLTEVRVTKLTECVIIVMTGSDMRAWLPLLEKLEEYARQMGCQKMVGVARPGWEKMISPYGYKKTHVQMEKRL